MRARTEAWRVRTAWTQPADNDAGPDATRTLPAGWTSRTGLVMVPRTQRPPQSGDLDKVHCTVPLLFAAVTPKENSSSPPVGGTELVSA